MPRYKLTIEFEGTDYVGWQRQTNGLAVQQVLEEAIEPFAKGPVRLFTAGRTDSGVHALGLVAHFDMDREMEARRVVLAINQHVRPQPISILNCEVVDEEFHARFSCQKRSYWYRIVNRGSHLTLDRHRAWWVPQELNADAMHEAAQVLVGHHDFSSFRAVQCQSESPVKTLDNLDVARVGNEIHVRCTAKSFLHHQVRNMVGSLQHVGTGRWTKDDLRNALEAKNRQAGGMTAPAHGLYFVEAIY